MDQEHRRALAGAHITHNNSLHGVETRRQPLRGKPAPGGPRGRLGPEQEPQASEEEAEEQSQHQAPAAGPSTADCRLPIAATHRYAPSSRRISGRASRAAWSPAAAN